MTAWIRAALLAVLTSMSIGSAVAQAPSPSPAPPPGMSKEQFDGLVEAISQAVVRKLKAEGQTVAGPLADKPAEPGLEDTVEEKVGHFIDRSIVIGAALPELGRQVLRIPSALGGVSGDGRGVVAFVALLGVLIAGALAAEWGVRWLLTRPRERLAERAHSLPGLRALPPLVGIAVLDGVGLIAVWLVSYGGVGAGFKGSGLQARVATFALVGVFAWRLYMFVFRVAMRPGLAKARLAVMTDEDAITTYARISTLILGIVAARVFLQTLNAMKIPLEALAAAQIIVNVGIVAGMIATARASRHGLGTWFASLGAVEGRSSLGEAIGRRWLMIAVPLFLLLGATQIFGAVSGRFTIPAAMLLTLNVLIGMILLETLSDYITQTGRGDAAPAAHAASGAVRHAGGSSVRMLDVIARCVRVAAIIFAVFVVAQTWVVDVLGLVDPSGWRALTRASFTAGTTLFVAFVLWELVKFTSARYSAKVTAPGAAPVDHDEGMPTGATRLATLMPLLRLALAIVIGIVALLIVLSELGVNITPLIAGASVFGLAISFGSQTLVRDIVSGIFYLADDAFRVGEYIDCGKAKGTVEGFTLRSIRLRHQNGQVHTIPFGQLGQITNFSRDWATLKFNLRFTRDTDLEKLRKLVKKIGQEMLEDPELKDEFLEPLKMQGVADILDNAIVVRFKFTVRPNKPTFVQRQAVKRMVAAFAPAGIEFATNTVAVQTMGGAENNAAYAGGALAKAQAEAAATTTTAASG
jgi:small-conductance mechanosensitive channel